MDNSYTNPALETEEFIGEENVAKVKDNEVDGREINKPVGEDNGDENQSPLKRASWLSIVTLW